MGMAVFSLKSLPHVILRTAETQFLSVKVLRKQFSSFSSHSFQGNIYSEEFVSSPFIKCHNQCSNKKHASQNAIRLCATRCYKSYQSYMSTVPRAPGDESPTTLSQDDVDERGRRAERLDDHDEKSARNCDEEDHENEANVYLGHIPVLVRETLTALSPRNNQIIVDMTFGAGGHARYIMKSASDLMYVASDRDPLAIEKAKQFSSNFRDGQVRPVLSRFSELPEQLLELDISPGSVDTFFMDLGASSMQFDMADRGFSLSRDGPLDMRMDGDRYPDGPTAADVVNTLSPRDIGQIIKKYGEESHANEIAHAIVEARYAFGKFTRTSQLADVIKRVFESSFRHDKLHRHAHVATKTFQALRIFLNDELNEINNGLEVARHFLKAGGRCVAISFHSLEDRIVKRHFHDINMDEKPNLPGRYHLRNASISYDVENIKESYLSGAWNPLSRKVILATEEEVASNPRARSAKLRAAIKT